MCLAFGCNTATYSCYTSCTGDGQCQSGNHHCYLGNNRCYTNEDGSPCDSPSQCAGGYCIGGACETRTIHRITVQCTSPPPGGGGPFRWGRVDADGALLQVLSAYHPSALYTTYNMPSDLTLSTDVSNGWYFAVSGSEGSGALTCPFSFYNNVGGLLGQVPIGPVGTDRIVRSGGSGDTYVRFLFSNGMVTSQEMVTP